MCYNYKLSNQVMNAYTVINHILGTVHYHIRHSLLQVTLWTKSTKIIMYKFRWIIFLSIIFLNYSFLHTNYKFLKNNIHHLHLYKYETEYYDFYNKFKHPILSSSQNDTIKSKLIEKNKNSYLLFERNFEATKISIQACSLSQCHTTFYGTKCIIPVR